MKVNRFRKILIGALAAVILTFSFSGCDALGIGNSGGDNKGGNNGTTGNNTASNPAVYISQTEISLAVGDTVQLQATSTDGSTVEWGSSLPSVATVVDGLVTGVSEGEVTVWASTAAVMATCTIKVNKAPTITTPGTGETPDPETLVLSLEKLSLEVGNSVTLVAKSSISGVQIIWESSNKTVATVSNGKITAKNVGKTTITANTGTAIAGCEITVTDPSSAQKPGYTLVWYDEFNGNSLDTAKWDYQEGTQDVYGSVTGPAYWGNSELQYYTRDAVSVSNGTLKITATRQLMGDRPFTSGRILTRDKKSWTYGYFEAKIKSPTGTGMWPAFWMLPQPSTKNDLSNKYGGWPYSGEIDVMEAKGRLMNKVDNTLHFGPVSEEGDNRYVSRYLTNEKTLTSNIDQWHTYAVEWRANYIAWFVDGTEVFRLNSDSWWTLSPLGTSAAAPFDQPFYILLNFAIGGQYDGYKDPDASFTTGTMEVDYVRVYA